MKLENPILLELETRSKSDSNSLASRLNLLASDLIEKMSQHHKRVIQVMPEFDLHDDSHLEKVLLYMAQLIGSDKIKTLSDIELFLLVASAYMHDCGMAPPEWELELIKLTEGTDNVYAYETSVKHDGKKPFSYTEAVDFIKSRKDIIYKNYKNEVSKWIFSENCEEDFIDALAKVLQEYQRFRNGYSDQIKQCIDNASFPSLNMKIRIEFIRSQHHICAQRYVKNATPFFKSRIPEAWIGKLNSDLGSICQSHGEDYDYLQKLDTNSVYCADENANLQFIATILRLADICHYTSERAPSVLRNAKIFESEYSYKEWLVKDAFVSCKITDGIISYYAYCDSPEKYYHLHKYLNWIDVEIANAYSLQREWSTKYHLSIKDVDRTGVDYDKSVFEPTKGLCFTLQQSKILKLLMGVGLYKDPYSCLRELYQNSMDACRCMQGRNNDSYNGKIEFGLMVRDDEKYLYCLDNGTGMNKNIIEKYLLKIGNSYYMSAEFFREQAEKGRSFVPTSQFGIGILSCFMIADRLEIITKMEHDNNCIVCCIDGPQENVYYRTAKSSENALIEVSGTCVRLRLKNTFAKELNNQPIEKLGLLLQYKKSNCLESEYESYNHIYDIWSTHIYKYVNAFVGKSPKGIMTCCKMSDGAVVPIYDKPLALRIGDYGIEESDRNFIDFIISRRRFYSDLTYSNLQDFLKPYHLKVDEQGVEYDTIVTMPLPGMPEIDDDSALFGLLSVSSSNILVDGITVQSPNSKVDNVYFNGLEHSGQINFTDRQKPQLSVDRLSVIRFPDNVEYIARTLTIKAIKETIKIAFNHINKYNLSKNKLVVGLIWKYIFDKFNTADVLFVNNIASSELGEFKWSNLTTMLGKDITISDFMNQNVITIPSYNFIKADLLTSKLLFAKLFTADDIQIDESNNVTISCKKNAICPEFGYQGLFNKYLVPVSNDFEIFREYDIVSSLYPMVPERLVESLNNYSFHPITNSRAISVHDCANSYTAFFTQDPRMVNPSLGLYTAERHFRRQIDNHIYKFDNKRSDFQFLDFGYDNCDAKEWMLLTAYIAPVNLTIDEKQKLEEYKETDPEYYKGVLEGWTILTTAKAIDNMIVMPGKRERQELIDKLSDKFWEEYSDVKFKFLDGTVVLNKTLLPIT